MCVYVDDSDELFETHGEEECVYCGGSVGKSTNRDVIKTPCGLLVHAVCLCWRMIENTGRCPCIQCESDAVAKGAVESTLSVPSPSKKTRKSINIGTLICTHADIHMS